MNTRLEKLRALMQTHAIDILATELRRDMGLLDLNALSEMSPRLLLRLSGVPRQRGMPL